MSGNPGQKLHINLAPSGSPFFGNYLMEMLVDECVNDESLAVAELHESGNYNDDTFLSDRTVGLPTVWAIGKGKSFWHNSKLTMEIIDIDIFSKMCSFIGTWLGMVTTINNENLPELLASAGAYALRHINEEYRRIIKQMNQLDFRPGADVISDVTERMRYRLQIDIERLRDFSELAPIAEIDHEINLLTTTERLIAELKTKAFSIKKANASKPKWFSYASSIIPARATIGFPYDQIKVSKSQRRRLPDNMIYGPFAHILSNMDGQKNLQRIIQEVEWEVQEKFSEIQIKKYLGAIMYLGDHDYLKVDYKSIITQTEIIEALHKLGVKTGDCLLIHSSISAFGRLEGGAETVINSILEVLGENGTALFPTFTASFNCFDGMLNKSQRYRPFDKNNLSQIWVGKIPQTFLKRKNVLRSNHPSHSVAGIGPLAEKCIKDHKEDDSPTGKNSPFAKLLELNGKILYFGSSLASSTFLHLIEDYLDMPYLKGSLCSIKDENGKIRNVYIPKNLPGDRDFYHEPANKCKFFKRASAAGLSISKTPLGLGELQLVEMKDFFSTGMKILREEPDMLLCDNPECLFCRKYKSMVN